MCYIIIFSVFFNHFIHHSFVFNAQFIGWIYRHIKLQTRQMPMKTPAKKKMGANINEFKKFQKSKKKKALFNVFSSRKELKISFVLYLFNS